MHVNIKPPSNGGNTSGGRPDDNNDDDDLDADSETIDSEYARHAAAFAAARKRKASFHYKGTTASCNLLHNVFYIIMRAIICFICSRI